MRYAIQQVTILCRSSAHAIEDAILPLEILPRLTCVVLPANKSERHIDGKLTVPLIR